MELAPDCKSILGASLPRRKRSVFAVLARRAAEGRRGRIPFMGRRVAEPDTPVLRIKREHFSWYWEGLLLV